MLIVEVINIQPASTDTELGVGKVGENGHARSRWWEVEVWGSGEQRMSI